MSRPPPEYDDALHVMEKQGGSFVKSLAHCYCSADPVNRAILRQSFARYFEEYEARWTRSREALAAWEKARGRG